jgi:hypothetical protein
VEKDVWNGLMVNGIKVIFFMIKCMEAGNFFIKMDLFFREIGQMAEKKEYSWSTGLMAR